MPYIVDTDMGVDDWMALVLLFARPFDVAAITVSGTGLAHPLEGIRNLYRLLSTIGDNSIPLAYGPDRTVDGGDHRFPEDDGWGRVPTDGIADKIQGHLAPVTVPSGFHSDAPGLLIDTIHQSGPVDIIALGPLTNVAMALERDPTIAKKIERIFMMGGAIQVPGNVPPGNVSEWNIWVDPVAANAVFQNSDIGHRWLVPLDLTNQVKLDSSFQHAVCSKSGPGPEIVSALLELSWITPAVENGNYYFWDSLAAAIAAPGIEGTKMTGTYATMTVDVHSGRIRATPASPGTGILWFNQYVPSPASFPSLYLDEIAGGLPSAQR